MEPDANLTIDSVHETITLLGAPHAATTAFQTTASFQDRLQTWSNKEREQAAALPPGHERDALLRKARQADTASHLEERANSPGLQPPG